MSDYYSAVRARRRVLDDSNTNQPQQQFEDHEQKKKDSKPVSHTYYNPLNTVFNASPAQLWNSAQEAFSSIQQSPYTTATERVPTPEPVFPELSIFGDPIDNLNLTMPFRDRTSEFKTTAKSYQMKVQGNGHRPPNKHEILADSTHFNQLAKRIGRDLSMTCSKMEKLAELAKRRSLFDENSEIEQLSRVVREDITGLNKQIASLQEFSKRRTEGFKTQSTGHSQLVVVGLQSKLASVSKDYQSVLEISTENMKHQKSRREKFSQADPVPMSLPSSSTNVNIVLNATDHDRMNVENETTLAHLIFH
ncbi:unnamed protein product [Auanema sp. JU1783]|nr:unnamed protein product [Auanema sp. JU1783]